MSSAVTRSWRGASPGSAARRRGLRREALVAIQFLAPHERIAAGGNTHVVAKPKVAYYNDTGRR